MSNISRNIAKQTTLKARSRIVNHQTELATKAELKQWLRDNCPEALVGNTRASKDEFVGLVNEVKYGSGGYGGRFQCQHATCTHVVQNFVVAKNRQEHEPCQAGTVGCCVDHDKTVPEKCETW